MGSAVPLERAAGGRMDARENLDHRRFAGAVVAEQAKNFAGANIEIDRAQGMNASERFADIVKLKQRRRLR